MTHLAHLRVLRAPAYGCQAAKMIGLLTLTFIATSVAARVGAPLWIVTLALYGVALVVLILRRPMPAAALYVAAFLSAALPHRYVAGMLAVAGVVCLSRWVSLRRPERPVGRHIRQDAPREPGTAPIPIPRTTEIKVVRRGRR